MSRNIIFYPTLRIEHIEKLDCKVESFSARYTNLGESIELQHNIEFEDGVEYISVVDDTGRWAPDKYNLIISGMLCVNNIDILFGQGGLVSEDTELGIGIAWGSKNSNIRGSKKIGNIAYDKGNRQFPFKIDFDEATLRGNLNISFQLFIVETGVPVDYMLPGLSLGELAVINVTLEGMGSTFTVFEKNAPGEPLWNVECNWEEPEYSSFSESVRVTINIAHQAWILAASDERVRKELLKEIMASSMQIVISELDLSQYDKMENYEPGSVCDAIFYLIDRASLQVDSYASLAKSIRQYLDKVMK